MPKLDESKTPCVRFGSMLLFGLSDNGESWDRQYQRPEPARRYIDHPVSSRDSAWTLAPGSLSGRNFVHLGADITKLLRIDEPIEVLRGESVREALGVAHDAFFDICCLRRRKRAAHRLAEEEVSG